MKLTVAPAALADLARLREFLVGKDPAAAERAIVALITAIESLGTFPECGRPSGTPKMRELIVPFGRSAYVVRYAYSASNDEVTVVRIWHGREARD
jgi:plasmid stabilization system protein ParE